MRIVININRVRKGVRASQLDIRTYFDTDQADDTLLHNAGIELYNLWAEALSSSVQGALVRNEGYRRGGEK